MEYRVSVYHKGYLIAQTDARDLPLTEEEALTEGEYYSRIYPDAETHVEGRIVNDWITSAVVDYV